MQASSLLGLDEPRLRSASDPLLIVGLGALAGGPLALSPLATAAAALAVGGLAWRAGARVAVVLAVTLALVGGARARSTLASADAELERWSRSFRGVTVCSAEGEVVTSPVALPALEPGAPGLGRERVDVLLSSLRCAEREVGLGSAPPRARLYGAPTGLARGDRVRVVASLGVAQRFDNEGSTSSLARFSRSGVRLSGSALFVTSAPRLEPERGPGLGALLSPRRAIDHARAHVRARIDATFEPSLAPLARALVLGEGTLVEADDEAFRASGLSHLLAVSGTHLVLAVGTLVALLRALFARLGPVARRVEPGRLAAGLGVALAALYADFAGGSGSAVRAALMLSVSLVVLALARRPCGARSLGASLALAGLVDPLALADLSFVLSTTATFGLLFVGPRLEARVRRLPASLASLARPLGVTVSAMVPSAPVLLLVSPGLPLLGVVANLFAGPLGELVALPVCLAHAVLAPLPGLEALAARLGGGALALVRLVAVATARVGPTLTLPTPSDAELALSVVLVLGPLALPRAGRRVALASLGALVLAELAARMAGAPRARLRVTLLDVGQGDALLVDFPDGRSMLVDTGGLVGSPVDTGKRAVLPLLRARRRARVDTLVVSHPHPDHYGGLAAVLDGVEVGEVWDTGQGPAEHPEGAFARVLARARGRGVPVRSPGELCGRAHARGAARVEVLAPCPSWSGELEPNDNSFVLRLVYGRRAILLTGDAEREREAELVALRARDLRADVLKVGHHGSRTSSTPAFLAAVRPEVALVSTGARNRFGHPHPEAEAALAHVGASLFRTDLHGGVVVDTDGERLTGRPSRRAERAFEP